MSPKLVIGIAGGSGSGKTTLVERLFRGPYADHMSLLPLDAYYLDAPQVPVPDGHERNWDHPEALDHGLYVDHITRLLNGQPVNQPVYDFAHDCRTALAVEVVPRTVLLLEGILLFAIPAIRALIDLRVFLDTPADVRVIRRTLRDVDERGRTFRSVASQYEHTVRPMHEQFVEPSRYHAHVIIPWLYENHAGVELLMTRIAAAVGRPDDTVSCHHTDRTGGQADSLSSSAPQDEGNGLCLQ